MLCVCLFADRLLQSEVEALNFRIHAMPFPALPFLAPPSLVFFLLLTDMCPYLVAVKDRLSSAAHCVCVLLQNTHGMPLSHWHFC